MESQVPKIETACIRHDLLQEVSRVRRRVRSVPVGEKIFNDMNDYDAYFRCGKHRDNASPCVQQELLDSTNPVVTRAYKCIVNKVVSMS